jgi:hypothetical protein
MNQFITIDRAKSLSIYFFWILIIFFTISIISCKKDGDDIVISVQPNELRQTGNPGDVITYQISVQSKNKLGYFRIYLQPENQFENLIIDSALISNNFNFRFQYQIPNVYAGKLLYLRLVATDENGKEATALRQIKVGDELLNSYSGLKLRTRANSLESAFNLETISPEIAFTADSTNRDLQEFTQDTTSQSPSMIWFSPAGGKFVKSNNFDFANATYLSVKSAFESSVRADLTDSLRVNDIYIHLIGGTTPPAYVAIRIADISDSIGISNDYYLFDIKK